MRGDRTRPDRRPVDTGWRAVLLAGLATACALAVTLVPDWEHELSAQTYEEFGSVESEAQRDAEAERKVVENRLREAQAEPPTKKWGVFVSLGRDTVRRSRSQRENGFDSETPGALVGLDRRLSDTLLLGLAAGLKVTDLSFGEPTKNATFSPRALGSQRTLTGTLGPYLSFTPRPTWHLNASFIAGLLHVSTARSGGGLRDTADGHTDGRRFSLALGGGYDFRYRALRLGPALNLSYDWIHVDGFSERGRQDDASLLLRVGSMNGELLTVKSGMQGSYVQRIAWGALIPNWRLDFVYRDDVFGESSSPRLSSLGQPGATFAGSMDRPDATSLEVGLGLQLALADDLTLWFDYEQNFLERFFVRDRVTVGFRKQF